MRHLVPPYIEQLRPYEPGLDPEEVRRLYGLDRVIKLASNENPLGPSPRAVEAMRACLQGAHRYPSAGGRRLREVLARNFHLKVENVITGNGSESLIANIVRAFLCDDDEVLTTEAAFIGFQVAAKSRGVAYRTVPYRDWRYDLRALAAAITPRTKIIYLANPNNPTGAIFTRAEFEEFHRRVPERVLIILDEAYFEYAQANPLYPDSMQYRYDNVITLRTFSKVYGLAGVRVGYGFAHQELIANLLKVKLPFEPSLVAEAGAIAALEDTEFIARSVESNAQGMAFLSRALTELGLKPVPSQANFLLLPFESDQEARRFTQWLLRQGIIIRPLAAFGLPDCVRISVGAQQENAIFIEAVERYLRLAPPSICERKELLHAGTR